MIYAWITQIGEQWVAHYTSALTRPPDVWGFPTAQEAVDWIMDEAKKLMVDVEWVEQ